MSDILYGAIEAGGTKINVAVGPSPTELLVCERIETTTPAETIPRIVRFFDTYRRRLRGVGIASFGPVRLDRSAPDWGQMLTTPKAGWTGASLVEPLQATFEVPIELDTDVNAAALAEHHLGALQGMRSGIYLTIGTGVGGGAILDGRAVHGALHPEMGHIRVVRRDDDQSPGCCPYHGDCLEGLASGPAIQQRWGASLSELSPDHVAHGLVAQYIGQACATFALILSAQRIVIGGGVSQTPGLHAAVQEQVQHWLAGYLPEGDIAAGPIIVAPALGDRAGLVGAMLLAEGRSHFVPSVR